MSRPRDAAKAAKVKASQRERTRRWRKRQYDANRKWVAQFKAEHGCYRCGMRDPVCLDLHHIDKSNKIAAVSILVASSPLAVVQHEAMKCQVVCANCHRQIHNSERHAVKVQTALDLG